MEPLNLKQASTKTGISIHMLKEMLLSGCIRGRKGLKAYIFFTEELLEDIRNQSGKKLIKNKKTGKLEWESISGRIAPISSYELPHQVDAEYNALLKRKTKN